MISQRKQIRLFWPVLALLLIFAIVFGISTFYFQPEEKISAKRNILDILDSTSTEDLIAMVFWDKDDSKTLRREIVKEKREGVRDEESIFNDS